MSTPAGTDCVDRDDHKECLTFDLNRLFLFLLSLSLRPLTCLAISLCLSVWSVMAWFIMSWSLSLFRSLYRKSCTLSLLIFFFQRSERREPCDLRRVGYIVTPPLPSLAPSSFFYILVSLVVGGDVSPFPFFSFCVCECVCCHAVVCPVSVSSCGTARVAASSFRSSFVASRPVAPQQQLCVRVVSVCCGVSAPVMRNAKQPFPKAWS